MVRVPTWFARGLGLGLLTLALLSFLGDRSFEGEAWLGPQDLAAQNSCELRGSQRWIVAARGTSAETHWFTRALFVCQDGSRIYSDSAIMSPPQRLSQLFGNVSFTEEGRLLTANRATYRTDIDRLDAFGEVVLVDSAGGSRIEGESLVYLRSGDARPQDQLTVTGAPGQRPRAVIVPRATPRDPLIVPDSAPADSANVPDSTAAPTLEILPDSVAAAVAEPDSSRLPYTVVADRIIISGEESFRGEGNAEVERGALKAYGTNMIYSELSGELLMSGNARSEGEGYELSGQTITVLLPGDEVREIVARRQAALLTDDLDLTAPKIRIFVDQEALQRLVAGQLREEDGPAFADAVTAPPTQPAGAEGTPGPQGTDPNRAVAVGEEFTLLGDSLDIETPGEVLERVYAIGRARAESYARDSLNTEGTPELALHDWIEGDTLVATFARRPPPDSLGPGDPEAVDPEGGDPQAPSGRDLSDLILDRLVATGSARSLYRMEANDSTAVGPKPLAIHYVLGTEITIEMQEGEIDQMAVSGDTRGFHLEPRSLVSPLDTLSGDSLIADTVGGDSLPADTLGADTTGTGSDAWTVGASPFDPVGVTTPGEDGDGSPLQAALRKRAWRLL